MSSSTFNLATEQSYSVEISGPFCIIRSASPNSNHKSVQHETNLENIWGNKQAGLASTISPQAM